MKCDITVGADKPFKNRLQTAWGAPASFLFGRTWDIHNPCGYISPNIEASLVIRLLRLLSLLQNKVNSSNMHIFSWRSRLWTVCYPKLWWLVLLKGCLQLVIRTSLKHLCCGILKGQVVRWIKGTLASFPALECWICPKAHSCPNGPPIEAQYPSPRGTCLKSWPIPGCVNPWNVVPIPNKWNQPWHIQCTKIQEAVHPQ